MFDIGFAELIIIALVGLVVIGPERLPEAARTAAKFLGRAKRTYSKLRRDLEHEIGADEIRRELYNEALLEELKQTREQLNETVNWEDQGGKPGEMTPLNPPPAGNAPAASNEPIVKGAPTANKEPAAGNDSSADSTPPPSTDAPKSP